MSARLRATLESSRNNDGGWPYLAGRQSRLEPTAWAMLALGDRSAARLLLNWRRDGLIVEPSIGQNTHAFNAIAALILASPSIGLPDAGKAVATALLNHRGIPLADHPAIKQDSSLTGWSWSDGAFSWAEPTAWCMLAVKKLCRDHPAASARLGEGERILRDRECKGGGWNYGNKEVYGQSLLPHIPPTAAGVLALQDRPSDPVVVNAARVLETQAPREGSTSALAVAWIALSALRRPMQEVAATLPARIETASAIGNLAVIGMFLYVLTLIERSARPEAFLL